MVLTSSKTACHWGGRYLDWCRVLRPCDHETEDTTVCAPITRPPFVAFWCDGLTRWGDQHPGV
nr:MAG TPA: hypothetical protein [Caudoviricetes sp.]